MTPWTLEQLDDAGRPTGLLLAAGSSSTTREPKQAATFVRGEDAWERMEGLQGRWRVRRVGKRSDA